MLPTAFAQMDLIDAVILLFGLSLVFGVIIPAAVLWSRWDEY